MIVVRLTWSTHDYQTGQPPADFIVPLIIESLAALPADEAGKIFDPKELLGATQALDHQNAVRIVALEKSLLHAKPWIRAMAGQELAVDTSVILTWHALRKPSKTAGS